MKPHTATDPMDHELDRLLAQHYGDGQIYFTTSIDPDVFLEACRRGLVSHSGMLTAAGRQWATAIPATVH